MSIDFERILRLKRVGIFSLLRTDQLHRVVGAMEPVEWLGGERLFSRGDPADAMYLIVRGRVKIALAELPSADSKGYLVELGPGDSFGEMSLLDDQPRSASAVAQEVTMALALARESLHGLLRSYPGIGVGMLRALSLRLRDTNRAIETQGGFKSST